MEPLLLNTTIPTNESFAFNMSKQCVAAGNRLKQFDEAYAMYRASPRGMNLDFALFAVIVSAIAVMGLAGNGILVLVLRKSKNFAMVAPYFICLAVCDSMFIVLNHFGACILFGLKHVIDMKLVCGIYDSYHIVYGLAFLRASVCSGGLLMGTLTVTRVISVFRPLACKRWLTSKFNWRLAISLTVVPQVCNVFFFASAFIRECLYADGTLAWNMYKREVRVIIWLSYILSLAPVFYSGYIIWVLIVVLNVVLIWKLRNIRRQRRQLTEAPQADNTIRVTAALLLCVTMTFCHLLMPVYTQLLFDTFADKGVKGICRFPTQVSAQRINYGFRLLLTLNSSVNFYWFLLFGSGFRSEVANTLLFWRKDTSTKKNVIPNLILRKANT